MPGSPFLHAEGAADATLHAFFLGTLVKAGPQTVKITVSGADSKRAVAYSATSDAPYLTVQPALTFETEIGSKLGAVWQWPSKGPSIRTGTGPDSLVFGFTQTGLASTAEFGIVAPSVMDFTHDFGSQTAGWAHMNPADVESDFLKFQTAVEKTPRAVLVLVMRPVRHIGIDAAAFVSSLSTTAGVGDTQVYLADATNGVYWDLIYDGKNGELPWKKIGGPPLLDYIANDDERTVNSYADLATKGPSVVVPLKGDYRVACGSQGYSNVAAAVAAVMSYKVGATEPADIDGARSDTPAIKFFGVTAHSPKIEKKGLAAGTEILAKYKSFSSNNARWLGRWLEVDPVRVG